MKYVNEINKRRTFAIISHPDAGKTTLTEKFLLFGGAIQTAGAVKSNKIKKFATSDLMEVCRMRDTPVIVFINKMDRDGKNRFDLLEEIEKELNIHLHPMTWPINSGKDFKGVYNLYDKNLVLFTANTKATDEDTLRIDSLDSTLLEERLGEKDA